MMLMRNLYKRSRECCFISDTCEKSQQFQILFRNPNLIEDIGFSENTNFSTFCLCWGVQCYFLFLVNCCNILCLDAHLPSHTTHNNWVISSHQDHYLALTIAFHSSPPSIHLSPPGILIVVTTLYITLHYPNFIPQSSQPFKLTPNLPLSMDKVKLT